MSLSRVGLGAKDARMARAPGLGGGVGGLGILAKARLCWDPEFSRNRSSVFSGDHLEHAPWLRYQQCECFSM